MEDLIADMTETFEMTGETRVPPPLLCAHKP